MKYKNIIVETETRISRIIINRPEKLNALNRDTIEELHSAFDDAKGDDSVQLIVVTGSGNKAFIAGADIREFADFSPEEGKELSKEGHEKLFDKIAQFPKPVIAAINGFALGGGLELAMACHFRIAGDNAKMGLPEVSLGVIPGYGGTQRLPELVGKGRAMEMIMTAGMIDAREALEYNLVNHVVSTEELMDFTNSIAEKILRNSPVAISAAIRAVNAGFEDGVNGYRVEIEEFGNSFGTEDFKEGTGAFLKKRKASFPGK